MTDARLLHDWFERITETQRLQFDLERTAKFDRLGVNKTLLQIESAFDRKRLVGSGSIPSAARPCRQERLVSPHGSRTSRIARRRFPQSKTEDHRMKKFMHGVFPLIWRCCWRRFALRRSSFLKREQKELGAALSEAGNSPVEFARASNST